MNRWRKKIGIRGRSIDTRARRSLAMRADYEDDATASMTPDDGAVTRCATSIATTKTLDRDALGEALVALNVAVLVATASAMRASAALADAGSK